MNTKVLMLPNPPTPSHGVQIDSSTCDGCLKCVNVCPTDVLMPNPDKKRSPIVLYPDECWFCAGCVEECPVDAITLVHPLPQAIALTWKRKASGECFRVGMRDAPPPNLRPPSGGQ